MELKRALLLLLAALVSAPLGCPAPTAAVLAPLWFLLS